MTNHSPNQLATQLEKDREEIADLQERVRRLVARRVDKVPEKKKEAEELQRGVETLAHATAGVDTRKAAEASGSGDLRAAWKKLPEV